MRVIFHAKAFLGMNGGAAGCGTQKIITRNTFTRLKKQKPLHEILNYPWPDLEAPYRYDGLDEKVANLHAQGYAVRGSADVSETVFEIAWQLRSMDRLFQDMFHNEEMASALLDQIILRNTAQAQAYARAGVDILYVGDDVAMQTGLMMSRKLWLKWLQPRLGPGDPGCPAD